MASCKKVMPSMKAYPTFKKENLAGREKSSPAYAELLWNL
jgi:hypothetical protein